MDSTKFWTGFAVGILAGSTVGLLCAPQSGARTRRQLRRRLEDADDYLRGTAEVVGNRAEKAVRRSRDVVEDALNSANTVVKRVVAF
jgi:gas vesicle protein